ncbi:F-box/LRR-repeat protein fbxl-1-like [Diprion similis]|uniref:F-box/LRR-repeat protein fbxl-1-like n=1 Tax=Diprion similis TaxID=362088 RepID=UPI001EF83545|nr:F-box/LRR-repeat protein fbxl-1-like [Diprion similis]
MASTSGTQVQISPTIDRKSSRRLFVGGLAPYARKRHLTKLIKIYEAESIILPEASSRMQKYPYVTFQTPELATVAMEKLKGLKLHKKKLHITYADQWQEIRTLKAKPKHQDRSIEEDPLPGFKPKEALLLLVEIISTIARYLQYKDRARLELVSRQWNAGSKASHKDTGILNPNRWEWTNGWNQTFNDQGLFWLVKRCRNYIEEADLRGIQNLKSTAVTILAKNCPNSKRINSRSLMIREGATRSISEYLTKLETLELGQIIGPIDMDIEKILANNTRLKRLALHNNETTGRGLVDRTSLEDIEIQNCDAIKTEELTRAIQNQRRLKRLEIKHCKQLTRLKLLDVLIANINVKTTLKELICVEMVLTAKPVKKTE